MATDQSTAAYIVEQLRDTCQVSVRRMFGEYALYCNGRVVGLICDNQLFIKYTGPGKDFAAGRFTEGYAYPGARASMNVTDYLDDRDYLSGLVRLTAENIPPPKVKRKRKSGVIKHG